MEKINLDQETEDWLIAFFNGELEENEIEKIGEWLIELIRNLNLQTYSLRTFLNMLESNGDKVYHARTDIWKNAIQLFDEKTIIGNGVGYFESTFNVYTHNFFLDIAVSSGIIGIIIMLTVLIVSIKKVIKIQDDYKKYFLIINDEFGNMPDSCLSTHKIEPKSVIVLFGNGYIIKRTAFDLKNRQRRCIIFHGKVSE